MRTFYPARFTKDKLYDQQIIEVDSKETHFFRSTSQKLEPLQETNMELSQCSSNPIELISLELHLCGISEDLFKVLASNSMLILNIGKKEIIIPCSALFLQEYYLQEILVLSAYEKFSVKIVWGKIPARFAARCIINCIHKFKFDGRNL